MNSRYTLARDRLLVNKGCDWLSDSSSSHWAWLISGKMLPWNFIISGANLLKFRLIGVSKLIIDLSHSRYFCDQHLEIYVSPNFGDRTPCNKNSFNLK